VRAVAAAVVAAAALAAWPGPAAGQSYRVPLDNPFAGQAGAAPEVYAMGLRNPFRFSFDRATGNLLIGDVGGSAREEINWVGAAAARGANFGWPCREGKVAGPVTSSDARCAPVRTYVEPLFEYGPASPMAVTAGFVVRDPALTGLVGRALFVDYFAGDVTSLALDTGAPATTGLTQGGISSFGEDAAGRLYFADPDSNEVRRLVSSGSGTLTSTLLTGAWALPIAIATVPGDPSRLLVGERGGAVRLVVNGVRQPAALAQVSTTPTGERGLLSVVAAPDFASTGRFFVYYTDPDGDIRVDEFNALGQRNVLTIEHSSQGNHNGGQLHFGRDGCLWISTGDGGGQNDLLMNAQNPATLLGKILRIDPNLAGPLCGGPAPAFVAPAQDTTPPRLRARVKRRQRVLRLRGAVAHVRCSESCSVAARGRLRIGRARYRMRPLARAAQAGQRVRLKVRLTQRGRRALRRCARRDRLGRASVRLNLRATDTAGLRSPTVRRIVRVRR
jgi:glucose/arabinose dehydrogenase